MKKKMLEELLHTVFGHGYGKQSLLWIGRKDDHYQLRFTYVRTYVIYLLGTYVTILCNWLIL